MIDIKTIYEQLTMELQFLIKNKSLVITLLKFSYSLTLHYALMYTGQIKQLLIELFLK